MNEILYVDLLIQGNDFVLNTGNEPELCNNRKSIGQDIIHSIIESGLATELIAERSPTMRADIFTRMELLIEDDERIVQGRWKSVKKAGHGCGSRPVLMTLAEYRYRWIYDGKATG